MSRKIDYAELGNAFAFVGTHDPTPYEIGELSSDILRKRYRELFATVDLHELATRLLAWIRVNAPLDAPMDIQDQVAWAETGLYELLERGAIRQVVQTPEATADLQKLEVAVAKSGLRPAPAAVAAADDELPVPVDPIDSCAADFRVLSSSSFRAKWMTRDTRAVYEQAVNSGRI